MIINSTIPPRAGATFDRGTVVTYVEGTGVVPWSKGSPVAGVSLAHVHKGGVVDVAVEGQIPIIGAESITIGDWVYPVDGGTCGASGDGAAIGQSLGRGVVRLFRVGYTHVPEPPAPDPVDPTTVQDLDLLFYVDCSDPANLRKFGTTDPPVDGDSIGEIKLLGSKGEGAWLTDAALQDGDFIYVDDGTQAPYLKGATSSGVGLQLASPFTGIVNFAATEYIYTTGPPEFAYVVIKGYSGGSGSARTTKAIGYGVGRGDDDVYVAEGALDAFSAQDVSLLPAAQTFYGLRAAWPDGVDASLAAFASPGPTPATTPFGNDYASFTTKTTFSIELEASSALRHAYFGYTPQPLDENTLWGIARWIKQTGGA